MTDEEKLNLLLNLEEKMGLNQQETDQQKQEKEE